MAINKNDLGDWSDRLPAFLDESTSLPISALTGHGLRELRQAIAAALGARDHDHEPLLVTALDPVLALSGR